MIAKCPKQDRRTYHQGLALDDFIRQRLQPSMVWNNI